jgi:riboflavin kinase/FMN adenylyltransferase
VVVPGNHDGVHRGHQHLIERARASTRLGEHVVVLTFFPHPLAFLRPERAPEIITPLARRIELLERAGADRVHVARFDAEYAAQSAETWATQCLKRELGARAVVIGPDYRFGKDRVGTPTLLTQLGLAVVTAEAVRQGGEPISSTRVRSALAAGDAQLATRLLGRVHDVEGVVIEGQRRGRTLGFPTANLGHVEGLVPADGVYAVVGRIRGESEPMWGVANLGQRPTVSAGRSLEAHFFDVSRDLYGQRIRLGFVGRLRAEQKFDSLDRLVAQIRLDSAQARQLLASADPRTFP